MPWTKPITNEVSLITNARCCVCNDTKKEGKGCSDRLGFYR
jgi:hypothetical protein